MLVKSRGKENTFFGTLDLLLLLESRLDTGQQA